MQNIIEITNSAANPRAADPKDLNRLPRQIQRPLKLPGSGFTREEMRRIVAEQID